MMTLTLRKVCETAVGMCSAAIVTSWFLKQNISPCSFYNGKTRKKPLPPRSQQIATLESDEVFDVLIIGGGATGVGCALDAVTRGLRTALVEADDFASGTSSKSTKLIHGGVRYLQKALMGLDYEQYKMVKEALEERGRMLKSAPHLASQLSILIPIYHWWKIPYLWVGLKCYDFISGFGRYSLKGSYYLSKSSTLKMFPMLKSKNLCGSIVYHDGVQDDARMCLAIVLTAARHGAIVCNHVEVQKLLKNKNDIGKEALCGAIVKDHISGKEFKVKAKCIINATGPFTDSIRKMDDSTVKPICTPSSGVHIVLPGYFCPKNIGLLEPSTPDGRVLFMLPWKGHTIAGTTDFPCGVTNEPKPTEKEILFLLNEIKNYFNEDVVIRRSYVLASWSGIRPLVSDPNKSDTQSLARNHIVNVSPSNLITIAGGKWTTYRAMAEHTIDAAVKACNLKPLRKKSITKDIKMDGAINWTPTTYISLIQEFGMDVEVAQNLSNSYGSHAFHVAKMAESTLQNWPITGKRIHPDFPFIYAEIRYGIEEYACTATDMISRRIRLAFLNAEAALEVLPCIVDAMGELLNWSAEEKLSQKRTASNFIFQQMGLGPNRHIHPTESDDQKLTCEEKEENIKRFSIIDKDFKGFVLLDDIYKNMEETCNDKSRLEFLAEMLQGSKTKIKNQFDLDEYLQFMSTVKFYDTRSLANDQFLINNACKKKRPKTFKSK